METEYRIVVQLEHTVCTVSCLRCTPSLERAATHQFVPDLGDPTGARVFRQIHAEVRKFVHEQALEVPDPLLIPIDVVMPGSLENQHTVVRVSRLNIHEPCDLNIVLGEQAVPYTLTNDVFASALGQLDVLLSKELAANWDTKTVLFVYVDEGVGSLVFHKGSIVRGAGFAGPLGHAIVEPAGQYFDNFRARGCLEAYCSRPSMSSNIVNRYFTDREKDATADANRQIGSDAFRRALSTIELGEKDTLPYELLNEGVRTSDPLALFALREATDYLGLAISHLIVSLNPHLIILDGAMVHKIGQFFDQTLASTRRYTWVDAWNATVMVRSVQSDMSAPYGAACAARQGRLFHDL